MPIMTSKSATTTEHSSTTTTTTTSTSTPMHHSYNINLRIIAICVAALVFILIIIRLCVFLTRSSRFSNNRLSNHRLNLIRPQISIIAQNHFKPDLPPDYTEAIANNDLDEGKLPSYDELHNQQTLTTTQM